MGTRGAGRKRGGEITARMVPDAGTQCPEAAHLAMQAAAAAGVQVWQCLCEVADSRFAFLRYTLETPAKSTTTLVLTPSRYTLPVPEDDTMALPMVPFTSTLPVLQAAKAKHLDCRWQKLLATQVREEVKGSKTTTQHSVLRQSCSEPKSDFTEAEMWPPWGRLQVGECKEY